MLYGVDTPLALGLLGLWTATGIQASRLRTASAHRRRARTALVLTWISLAVAAGYGLAVLTGLSWFATPAHTWLYLVLTAIPAAVVGVLTLPRLSAIRRPAASAGGSKPRLDHPSVVIPPQGAAMAALVNLFFLAAPYPQLRVIDVAVPIALLAIWTGVSVLRYRRREGESPARTGTRFGRVAVSVTMVASFVVAWAVAGVVSAPEPAGRTPVASTELSTGSVSTEGDELYFEVRGQGPPLLMIPGGGGDAAFYTYVADILAEDYQVISYDRRGNSRSTRNFPDSFDIAQQARDALAVTQAAGHDSAHIFGNSAGAVIALELAAEFPSAVRTVVAHEPPSVQVLPDSGRWLGLFASVYRTSFVLNPQVANLQFTLSIKAVPFSAFGQTPDGFGERSAENDAFFIRNEMLPVVNYRPDMERIAANGVDIEVAAGELTLQTGDYYGRTAPVLADEIGQDAAVFPGHHLSYFDQPHSWAATLGDLLDDH